MGYETEYTLFPYLPETLFLSACKVTKNHLKKQILFDFSTTKGKKVANKEKKVYICKQSLTFC